MRYLAAILFLPLYTAALCWIGVRLIEAWFHFGAFVAALGGR